MPANLENSAVATGLEKVICIPIPKKGNAKECSNYRTIVKSLLQHILKASVLCCSAFFIVQLSHPYMTTGKTRALTRWTFVGKVTSLLFIFIFTSHLFVLSGFISINILFGGSEGKASVYNAGDLGSIPGL